MDAHFVRRSAVLGRILPVLALFWPTVPGAEVRATRPLDNSAHDNGSRDNGSRDSGSHHHDTDRTWPVPQPREQAPFVALPGVPLAAQADGSDTFVAALILPEGRRLDPATADLRLEAGQGLSGADALTQTLFTGLDLDALAGGRLLDLSLRDHFSTGETTLVLLGSEATFLYELT